MEPWATKWLALLACAATASGEWYDTYSGNQITEERAAALAVNGMIPYCAIEVRNCSSLEPRRMDYSCNNLHYPSRGTTMTPFLRMLPPEYATNGQPRIAKSGRPLPNARALRVALIPDGRVPNKRFTHMVTTMTLMIAGDVTSVHDTINYVALTVTCCLPGGDLDPRCIPIRVPEDDVHLRMSNVRCLNLTRAITYQRLGCIPDTLPPERVNTATPMLDLSTVYGSEAYRGRRLRGERGRLRSELLKDKEWPEGNAASCINNVGNETRCHELGDEGTNSLIGINLASMWFFRNHNSLADKLYRLNPCWDDDKIYAVAREINIATAQNLIYYELMPSLIDHDYLVRHGVIFPEHGHVEDYDETLEPRVTLEYVMTARWFHTLQEGRMNMYDSHGKLVNRIPIVDLTFRTGLLALNNTIEGITQGCFRQPCASLDHIVDPEMGERSLGRLQRVSDVLSADIMKNRDGGLPAYNKYRALCKLPVAKDFDDLLHWMPKQQVEALSSAYEDVDDVDLYAGIIGERPMPNSVLGPTLACITTEQLLRWRRADRFWFENTQHAGAFTSEQLHEIRKTTLAKFLCQHGDGVHAIQPSPLMLPGPGNELVNCAAYRAFDFEPWRDDRCHVNHQDPNHWGTF